MSREMIEKEIKNVITERGKLLIKSNREQRTNNIEAERILRGKLEGYDSAVKEIKEWLIPLLKNIAFDDQIPNAIKKFEKEFEVKQ